VYRKYHIMGRQRMRRVVEGLGLGEKRQKVEE